MNLTLFFVCTGDKPFSCDICHKKFALSCNLRAHLKTHEAEYQSSQASLALYQRALAVLNGAQQSQQQPKTPESNAEEDNEDQEEILEEEEETNRSQKSDSPGMDQQQQRIEFSKQLTVAV